ncbi:MAG: type II toxin-antitoxin system prevent-host-death family antitoxin [Micrococcales bacterium]|nr:type II toxin-antitoxin system prevent-host-death family antitoxin [Micrococcales bacterium]
MCSRRVSRRDLRPRARLRATSNLRSSLPTPGQSPEWYRFTYYSLGGVPVSAITATEARKSLFGLIQQVNDDHTTVEVVSRRGNAVIMSKDDYDALTETAYLLRNPANAERLLEAVERARRGEFEQHDLVDP